MKNYEGSKKVGHIYNEDLGTKSGQTGKSVHDYEGEIIKGIDALDESNAPDERVWHNQLMRYLVDEQRVIGKPTLGKYLTRMINERKLIRTNDTESNKVFYRVAPELYKNSLPSDEEELRKWINLMDVYMPKLEQDFPKITLLDKVQLSGYLYQSLRRICTWHEIIFLRETIIKPFKTDVGELNAKFGRPLSFSAETFLSLRGELNGIISDLFSIIGKDANGKAIQQVLQLHALLPEKPLDISFVKEYNDYVAFLEKKLKKEGSPMIFTDADGKPLDVKPTLKKIPLENRK